MTLVFALEVAFSKHTQWTCHFCRLLAAESIDLRVHFLQRFRIFMYRSLFLCNNSDQTWLSNALTFIGRGSSIGSEFAWHASGPEFDPHVRHILSWRLWSWKHFYGHSPSSADSRRVVVSYWRKNVHQVLVNFLGGLPRKVWLGNWPRPKWPKMCWRALKQKWNQN